MPKAVTLKVLFSVCWLVVLPAIATASQARQPAPRITNKIDNTIRTAVHGARPPWAHAANDVGRVAAGKRLRDMAIVFSRSAAQKAALRALIAAQQDSASPLYHKWLTPQAFAARFGVADADIATVKAWLIKEGFSVDGVALSKNRLEFSGTASQVEAAFGTQLHYYKIADKTYFAPSQTISVPAALSSVVRTVTNLSNFRPRPHIRMTRPRPQFTSSQTSNHFLTPADVATIYDMNGAYDAGYTGAGQSIAVVGQSAIQMSDIENFQNAAGLAVKDPTLVLVPGSGNAVTNAGDEAESDVDLEYTAGVAPGATLYFVYVGDNSNYSVWDALTFAIDYQIAPVISMSYGICEGGLTQAQYADEDAILAQAAAQGQSIIVPAGDAGSTDCFGQQGLTTSQQEALAVDFPASSEYATGVGGTEFSAADAASSNTTYWQSANGTDVISSALSYIPEQVWNDDSSTSGLGSGGGGVSAFTARPGWQAGVLGIDSGAYRLVPDISLDASPMNAGYLYCSSDSTTGISGSCSHGFRDGNNQYLTVDGGTSVDAPIFAGMLAIINGKLDSAGQGVAAPILYALASDAGTYASAFHDITNGGNQCAAGASYCSSAGTSQYSAAVGYDEASGLGSVDFSNLLTAWPASSASLAASQTAVAAAAATLVPGATDTLTITVASSSGSTATLPTGTVSIVVDGTAVDPSLPLSNDQATYDFSSTTLGPHVVTATYSGDSTYASSTGTVAVTVATPMFTVNAANAAITSGSSGTSTITVVPQNGYAGVIGWRVSSTPVLANGCFSVPDTTVAGAGPVAATMTIDTSAASCKNAGLATAGRTGRGADSRSGGDRARRLTASSGRDGLALALLLVIGLCGTRSHKLGAASRLAWVVVAGVAVAGCGSSGSSPPANAAQGSYSVTIVGTNKADASINASATMTLTVN